VVAQWGCGGAVGMWWLSGDMVAQWGYGGSVGIWWLSGDVVAQWGYGGSVGMWWLSGAYDIFTPFLFRIYDKIILDL
jgi:hypothetical protein